MKKNTKEAFTLAEVLMVIAIIGAVAVLAVPNLKTGISEDTNIAKLKATYNQLETAINAVIADYGSVKDADESCASSTNFSCFNGLLAAKMDLQLNCGTTGHSKCYSSEKLKDFSGNELIDENSAYERCEYSFILSNGAAICYRDDDPGRYEIDVDGPKKGPTIYGVDIFETFLDDDSGTYTYDYSEDYVSDRAADAGFSDGYDEFAWAMTFGNMDYIKCASQLKWHSKTTCD